MENLNPPAALAMPFANNGKKNDIPVAPTGTNKASLTEGFPETTSKPSDEGGIPPARADFNGAMNLNSQFYFAFQNGWLPTFNAQVSTAIGGYPLGAKLWYLDAQGNTNMLISQKANNTDNFITNPSVIGTSWKAILVTQSYVDQNLALKVNKAGDTMSGQLVMANGSNGIRFNGPDTTPGWVGGDPSLNDTEKGLLYSFYYPSSETKTFIDSHPLGSGQAYTLYEGTRLWPDGEVINLMTIGWKDTSNVWCSVENGQFGTNATAPWWDTPQSDETITKTLPINQSMAPTSYQEASTDNFYYVKPGSGGLVEGDGTNENRILTTADKLQLINNIMPNYSAGINMGAPNNSIKTYTSPTDGMIILSMNTTSEGISCIVKINDISIVDLYASSNASFGNTITLLVNKGDVIAYRTQYPQRGVSAFFYPLKGV